MYSINNLIKFYSLYRRFISNQNLSTHELDANTWENRSQLEACKNHSISWVGMWFRITCKGAVTAAWLFFYRQKCGIMEHWWVTRLTGMLSSHASSASKTTTTTAVNQSNAVWNATQYIISYFELSGHFSPNHYFSCFGVLQVNRINLFFSYVFVMHVKI